MNQPYTNPFTPIFGKVPAYMAGREQLVQEMQAAFRSEGNDPSLVSLFVGPRGTGKTAMLSMCADMAEADGWVAARVTATKGMGAPNSIGAGDGGTCGTVTIGSTVYWDGSSYQNGGDTYLPTSPLVYPAP